MKKFWEWFKECYGNALLSFLAAFWLLIFIEMEKTGVVPVCEPNVLIRHSEQVLLALATVLGLERLVKDIIRMKRKK